MFQSYIDETIMSAATPLKKSKRDDSPIFNVEFPNSNLGQLLKGLIVSFLIKQEHRIGWARKGACDDKNLYPHPNETVASHQWGVAEMIMAITREQEFKDELPNFDRLKAIEMALIHDIAELKTGDITPVDGITPDEKHQLESDAIKEILKFFPDSVQNEFKKIYEYYEARQCVESKFVKDCDTLDFMLNAFMLELQGFTGFSEFYENSKSRGFSTKIAKDLCNILIEVRNCLSEKNLFHKRDG